ncbi:MAG: hypothetical protein EOP11_18675, partial [Proteobacteria bacterium]
MALHQQDTSHKPTSSLILRRLSLVSALLLVSSIPAMAAPLGLAPGPSGPVSGWELIADQDYQLGFAATKNCPNPDKYPDCPSQPTKRVVNPLFPALAPETPAWTIAEWGSKSTIVGLGKVEGENAAWRDPNKSVVIKPGGGLELAVNGLNEYDGVYPANWDERKWVHLLVSQTIAAPGAHSRPSGSLADMSKLVFSVDAHLIYEAINKKAGYDRARHASQVPMSITIQNLTRDHPGFGQYIWLQIPIYEDREEFPGDGDAAVDQGTGSLMYSVPYRLLASQSLHKGQWVHLEKDILDHAKAGIKKAFELGMLKSGNFADYHVGGFNVGFELPGMNTTTLELKKMSIKVSTSNLYPATGIHTDMNSKSVAINGNPVPAAPTEAPAKPANPAPPLLEPTSPQPTGFFRLNGTDTVYYSNGADAFCFYPSAEAFFRAGGARDFSNVTNRQGALPDMRND